MLTVNPAELRGLLTDLLRTAGSDSTMPMLDGVLLHSAPKDDSTVLVGTSTDRFRIGQAHAPATGEMPATYIRSAQVKQLLSALKPYAKTHDLLSEIVVADDRARLTLKLPGDVVLPALTMTVHCDNDSSFPKLAHVMEYEVVTGEGQVAFNAAYVAAFGLIAKRRNEYLRFEVSYTNKPTVFYIGTRYQGFLMPVRLEQAGSETAPVFKPAAVEPESGEAAEAKPAA